MARPDRAARAVRLIAGIVAGVIVANLFVYGWEMLLLPLTPFAHPIAPDVPVAESIAQAPFDTLAWVAVGWTLCTFAGALAAFRLAYWDFAGWIVAAVVAGLCLTTLAFGAHPFAMQIWAIAGPFVGALFAFGLWRRWRAARLHLRDPR